MNEQSSAAGGCLLVFAAGLVMVVMLGVLVISGAGGGAGPSVQAASASAVGQGLRPDAPVPAQYLAIVLRAGSTCPAIGPAEIAAQIDLESSWRPDAYADSGEVPAKGIAQFTDATWASWGGDFDANGDGGSTWDPGDAIIAQSHLMCDLVAWAESNVAAGRLQGVVLDLAWAAYFDGRGAILSAGGVPQAGLAHDYPQQIRARLAKYAAVPAPPPIGPSGWMLPLAPHTYTLSSPFGPRWGTFHYGQDFAAPEGAPIRAVAPGLVIEADCTSPTCATHGSLSMPGCGYTVVINHGSGISTRYCHAVRLGVHAGEQVNAGQVIAWVGDTGNADGAHLHFEVHRGALPPTNQSAIDPIGFLHSVGLNP